MFARRRQVEPDAEIVAQDQEQQKTISGPAAKLMQMFGLSPDMLEQTSR